MQTLTSKELTVIEDHLSQEQNAIAKLSNYASACRDPQLKTQFEQIAAKHQGHYNRLLSHLS